MPQVSDNDSPSFLADLPEELNIAIIKELDMASIIALSQTSKQFHRLANPKDDSRRPELQEFLLGVQFFPRWEDGFACFSCAKVLPREKFACSQTRQKRGRHADVANQVKRFCVQCGVGKGLYTPGSHVVQANGVLRFVCQHCKKLGDGRFCRWCAICHHCDHTVFRGRLLKQCEAAGKSLGHEVLGNAIGNVTVTSIVPSLRLGVNRDEEPDDDDEDGYYDSSGRKVVQEWSPEWYDGPYDD